MSNLNKLFDLTDALNESGSNEGCEADLMVVSSARLWDLTQYVRLLKAVEQSQNVEDHANWRLAIGALDLANECSALATIAHGKIHLADLGHVRAGRASADLDYVLHLGFSSHLRRGFAGFPCSCCARHMKKPASVCWRVV